MRSQHPRLARPGPPRRAEPVPGAYIRAQPPLAEPGREPRARQGAGHGGI